MNEATTIADVPVEQQLARCYDYCRYLDSVVSDTLHAALGLPNRDWALINDNDWFESQMLRRIKLSGKLADLSTTMLEQNRAQAKLRKLLAQVYPQLTQLEAFDKFKQESQR